MSGDLQFSLVHRSATPANSEADVTSGSGNSTDRKKLKVRTGCITCKIRKVKCDEGRPACKRCTDTGRKCDGYQDPEEQARKKKTGISKLQLRQSTQSLQPTQQQEPGTASSTRKLIRTGDGRSHTSGARKGSNIPRSFSRILPANENPALLSLSAHYLSSDLTADERGWIRYFSQRTGPALGGFGEDKFWGMEVPQLSVREPAIRYALLALGSSYARYEQEAMGTQSPPLRRLVGRDFSITYYNKAIANLKQGLQQGTATGTTSLICCLLFICLECLYGNRLLVLEHLYNGLNILDSTRPQRGSEDLSMSLWWEGRPSVASANRASMRQSLEIIFSRLQAQFTLFGKPASFDKLDAALNSMPSFDFHDLSDADWALDSMMALCLNFIRHAFDGSFAAESMRSPALVMQTRLQERLLAWRNGMRVYEESLDQSVDTESVQIIALLKLEEIAAFIYLSSCFDDDATASDAFHADFAEMLRLVRSTLALNPTPISGVPCQTASSTLLPSYESSGSSKPLSSSPLPPTVPEPINLSRPALLRPFSLDAMLLPPLFLTGVRCRDPELRRAAVRIMEAYPGQEGLWEGPLHGRVARRVIEIEEAAMLVAQGAEYAFMQPGPAMRMCASNGAVLTEPVAPRYRVWRTDVERISDQPSRVIRVTFSVAPEGRTGPWIKWEEKLTF